MINLNLIPDFLKLELQSLNNGIAGADPGFDQGGGPDRDRPKLLMVHSSVM